MRESNGAGLLGRQSFFTGGKFISVIDGNQRYRAFAISGVSAKEWIRVWFQDYSDWELYRREGVTGDFPESS
jgi:hypothetical protein